MFVNNNFAVKKSGQFSPMESCANGLKILWGTVNCHYGENVITLDITYSNATAIVCHGGTTESGYANCEAIVDIIGNTLTIWSYACDGGKTSENKDYNYNYVIIGY